MAKIRETAAQGRFSGTCEGRTAIKKLSEREELLTAEKMFMRVSEVAETLDVSAPYAYKLIRKFDEEFKKAGCITISGRVDRKFFYEKFYGAKKSNERMD